MKVCLVVNPRSGHGATGKRLPAIRAAVQTYAADVTVKQTRAPGDGERCAREAVDEGADRVVAVGGDGTVHEVVNGLCGPDGPRRPDVVLGVIHGGTGGDFVRSLAMPRELDESARRVVCGAPRPIDLMSVRFVDHGGEPAHRWCVNVLGFGMNGEVVRVANASSKRFGGTLSFASATVRALARYRPPQVRVTGQGEGEGLEWRGALTSAFVANGGYCGGGMWVGRGGDLSDGLVEVTLVPDLPTHRAILATPHLYRGTASNVKEVSSAKISKLEAEALDGAIVLLDLDGEQPGRLPVSVDVIPRTLLVA